MASMEAVDHDTEAELEKAREIVSTIDLPPEITGIDIRSGTDLFGGPALWLALHVRDELEPDRDLVARLTDFGQDGQDRVVSGGVTLFPFTPLDQAA